MSLTDPNGFSPFAVQLAWACTMELPESEFAQNAWYVESCLHYEVDFQLQLGRGPCCYHEATWDAILVAPLVHRLHDVDDLTLFGQVCHCIAMLTT